MYCTRLTVSTPSKHWHFLERSARLQRFLQQLGYKTPWAVFAEQAALPSVVVKHRYERPQYLFRCAVQCLPCTHLLPSHSEDDQQIWRFGASPMFMTSWLCCHPMTSETSTHRLEPIPHWSSTTHPPAVAHWKLRLAGSQVLGSTQRSGNRASQLASGQSGVGPSTQTAW